MRAAAVLVIVMSAGSLVAATDWTGIAMKLDPSNQILSTWDSNSDACANPPFKGVKCNANKEVIEISLRSLGLSGEVPPEIVQLNKLTWLDLGENSLHGNIPVDIANLPSLMVLNLCCNNIGGVIPDLGRMSNLLAIDLSNNILSDTIPASLGNLPQLKFLELNNNQLSGEIPASIGNLKRLKSISLAHNQLQGRVPKGLNYLRDSPAKYNFSENVKPPVVKPPVVKPPVVKPPVVKPPVVESPPKVTPPVVKPPPKSPKPSPEKPLPSPSKSSKPSPSAPSASPSKPPPTTSPSPSPAKPSSPPSSPPPSANAQPSSPPPADDPQPVQPLVPLSPPPGSATPSASAPADTLSSGTAAAADSGSSGGNSSASASSSSSSGGESSGGMSMGVYIGIAAGGALLVIVATILIGYCCWWKPKQSRARAAAFRAIRSDKDLNPPSASKRGYGSSKSKGKARSPTGAEAAGGDAGGGSGAAAAAGAAAGAATGAAIAGSGRSSSKKKSPSKRHSPSKHHRIDIESGNNGASGYHSGYHTVDVPPVTVVELPPEPAVRSVREPEAAVSAVSATGAAAGAAIAGAGSKSKGRSGKSHSPSPKKDSSRSNPNADKESVGSSPRGDQHDPAALGGALGPRSIGGSGRSGSDRKTGAAAAAAAVSTGAAAVAASGSGRSPQTSPHKTRPESPRTRKSGSGSAEPAARDGGRKERKEHTPPKTERGSGNQSGRSPETSPSPKGHKDGSSRRLSNDSGNAAAAGSGAPVFEASPPAIPPSVPRNRDSTPPRMPSWSRTGNRNSPSPGGSNHRSSSPNRSYHGTPPKPAEPVPILREEGIPTVVEIPVDSDENQIKSGGSNRPVLIPPAVPIPQLKSMPAGAASRKKGGRNGGGAGEDDVSPAPQPNNMRRSGSGDERGEGRGEGRAEGSGAGMAVGATAVTPKYGAAGRALRVADLEEAGGEAEGEGEDDVVGELRSSSRKGGYGGGRGMGGGGGGMGGRGGVWTPPSGGSGGGADGAPEASDDVAGEGASLERFFTVAELSLATNDFGRQSQRNVLGTGRDGSVYKARLPDGTTVAVKRLTQRNLDQSAREFRFEVESLAHARHPNLVALLGCCAEEDERMLVYEFVPNGSLDAWLHQNSNMEPIDWPMRMHIAIGCARGLSHLHEGLDMKVVHRDVKASNVLLDAQWNPKLGDFAIAKVMGRDQSHTATRVVGTFGYVAPEYMNTGLLTERSDVYSFGVLLLEIISGRKPIDNGAPPDEMDLVTWAKKLSSQERLVEIVDPRLQGMISPDDAEYVLGIAMRCVETNALKRPRMTQIVHMLESEDPKQVSRRPFRPQPVQLMAI
ncbi:unnamed protein product [Closterium sp. NIES-54]